MKREKTQINKIRIEKRGDNNLYKENYKPLKKEIEDYRR
jgi:hypothetical protein